MTRFEELTTGTASATVIVHSIHDEVNDLAKFYLTRGPLERLRIHRHSRGFRFLVGLEVPVDSQAARIAFDSWAT